MSSCWNCNIISFRFFLLISSYANCCWNKTLDTIIEHFHLFPSSFIGRSLLASYEQHKLCSNCSFKRMEQWKSPSIHFKRENEYNQGWWQNIKRGKCFRMCSCILSHGNCRSPVSHFPPGKCICERWFSLSFSVIFLAFNIQWKCFGIVQDFLLSCYDFGEQEHELQSYVICSISNFVFINRLQQFSEFAFINVKSQSLMFNILSSSIFNVVLILLKIPSMKY